MQIYTLPALARALGVTYPVVYSLRQRGYLMPTQVNGSQEYYTLDDYRAAATRSVEEWQERRNTLLKPERSTQFRQRQQNGQERNAHQRIDYDTLFKKI